MAVRILTPKQQKDIVQAYTEGALNQLELSRLYGVHRRTIHRVLKEHGVVDEYRGQSEVLEIVRQHKLTPEKLRALMRVPALTLNNVQHFLNHCSQEELAKLFYTSSLFKLSQKLVAEEQAKQAEQVAQAAQGQPEVSHAR